MKILELFAGIGACSKALENLGIDLEIVDAVEIDKYAIKSFNAIHGTSFETQDICKWDKDLKNIDLITHGSPCQDFSIAGKQAGGDIASGTRSSLMYETLRIVEKIKPKYVLWENVKNMLSKKHKHNFDNYINIMSELGYNSYYQVLNAKDFGIPQNRERVYTISIRKDIDKGNFEFPPKEELKITLKDILEDNVMIKYYIKRILNVRKTRNYIQWDNSGKGYNSQQARAYFQNKLCPTIATTPDKQQVCLQDDMDVIRKNSLNIRKLTPKECWKLMGFSDEDFEKAQKVNSNTQLYKQAGNSIVVNVLEKIFKNLFKESDL